MYKAAVQGKHKERAAAQTRKQQPPRQQANKDAAGSVPWPPKGQGQWDDYWQTTIALYHPASRSVTLKPKALMLVAWTAAWQCIHTAAPSPLASLHPALPPTCPELNEGKVLVPVHVHIHNRLACTAQNSAAGQQMSQPLLQAYTAHVRTLHTVAGVYCTCTQTAQTFSWQTG